MEPRILSRVEMDLVFRLSKPETFRASADERGLIARMAGEGLLKIYPNELSREIEITQAGARSWFLTVKTQSELVTGRGGLIPPHSQAEKET